MKKQAILLTVVILLSAGTLAQAQEGGISGTLDLTYMSKYVWRGYDWFDNDHSAFQLGANINIADTGFGLSIVNTRAISSGDGIFDLPNQDIERLNVSLYYGNVIYEDEDYATNYSLGWVYYNLPDNSPRFADMQEFFVSLSWPELCPAGVVPSYTILSMWPSKSNSTLSSGSGLDVDASGMLHIFGIGYDMTVPELVPELGEQVVHLSGGLVYNDGVLGADHDWSHFVFGASTDFDLGNNLAFSPGLYYQASMEDTVNDEDETWVSLSLKYKF
ncbi:MAG: hypothetical protein ACYSUY_06695 [Planctomycetota bacterium]|jgi:hypothetical protein